MVDGGVSGRPIGLIAAMPGEIAALDREIRATGITRARGGREYHLGELSGRPVVLVMSRVGKVAAATTATSLIHDFDPSEIIFTGVAGALDPSLELGDIVIADAALQHDLDARPLFPRHEIPLLGRSRLEPGAERVARARAAAERFAAACDPRPAVRVGLIVSGDEFVGSAARREQIRAVLPDALCVEMEGAAVAQVCHEHGLPWTLVRVISDRADDSASVDFASSIEAIAAAAARGIVHAMLTQIP